MDKLPKAICSVCGGYHATKNVIHLSYVGHAALTDRLLEVDPSWTWEPLSLDQNGLPAIDKDGGLWIKLTVCGVSRLGYGDAQGKTGGDAMKERIGDALRNAAMRFGAALDLWHKGDLKPGENPDVVVAGADSPPPVEPQSKKLELTPSQKAYDELIVMIDAAAGKYKTQEDLQWWFSLDTNKAVCDAKSMMDADTLSAINRHFAQTKAILPSKSAGSKQNDTQDMFGKPGGVK